MNELIILILAIITAIVMVKVAHYIAFFVEYLIVLFSKPKLICVPKELQESILLVVRDNCVARLEYGTYQGIGRDAFKRMRVYVNFNECGREVYVDKSLLKYLNKTNGGVVSIDMLINNKDV